MAGGGPQSQPIRRPSLSRPAIEGLLLLIILATSRHEIRMYVVSILLTDNIRKTLHALRGANPLQHDILELRMRLRLHESQIRNRIRAHGIAAMTLRARLVIRGLPGTKLFFCSVDVRWWRHECRDGRQRRKLIRTSELENEHSPA